MQRHVSISFLSSAAKSFARPELGKGAVISSAVLRFAKMYRKRENILDNCTLNDFPAVLHDRNRKRRIVIDDGECAHVCKVIRGCTTTSSGDNNVIIRRIRGGQTW